MIQKKICMLGSYAVGKTSLVRRFVHSMFSDEYHTTVGVKIDKKTVEHADDTVNLILWDLYGDDAFQKVNSAYLRGMSGYLLIVDGTRPETLDVARDIRQRAKDAVGDVPFILVLNKVDLIQRWAISDDMLTDFTDDKVMILKSSAKSGEGVEEAFQGLVTAMLDSAA